MAIFGAHVIVYSRDPEPTMCDDLETTMSSLAAHGVRCTDITEAGWGRVSRFRLPGGGEVGIYEPRHPRTTEL